MSEVAGIKGIKLPIKEGIPQNEQGIKSAETSNLTERDSPLKRASRGMRYVFDQYLSDKLPFSSKSAAADKYLIDRISDKKTGEPKNYKEFAEALGKKQVILDVFGDQGPLEVLKGRESKMYTDAEGNEKQRKVAVLVLGAGNGGGTNNGMLLEMGERGLLDKVDGIFGVSSGAGGVFAEGAGRGKDFVSIFWEENCAKVKVIDKKTGEEREEGRFVKIPGGDDPKGQVNALLDAYENGSGKPILSTTSVEEALRSRAEALKDNEGNKFDVNAAIKNNPKDLMVLVMDKNTTNSELLDLKKVDDPIEAVGGAIDVPGVSDKGWATVNIDGEKKEYVDGAFGRYPIPIQKIFDMGYTDMVVLAAGPMGETGQLRAIQVFLAEIAKNKNGYGYSKEMIQLIRGHKRGSKIATDKLWDKIAKENSKENSNNRIVVIAPAKDSLKVEELDTDSEKIKEVYEQTRKLSGEKIFNPAVKLGSDNKPEDLKRPDEELTQMSSEGVSGKPIEIKPPETSEPGGESFSSKTDMGGVKVGEVDKNELWEKNEKAGKRVEELKKELWKYINNEQLMAVLKGVGKFEGRGKSTIDNVYDLDNEYNVRVMETIMDLVKRREIQTFVERDYKPANPLTRSEEFGRLGPKALMTAVGVIWGIGIENPITGLLGPLQSSKDPVVYALLKDYSNELKEAKKAKAGREEAQKAAEQKKPA